MAAENWRRLKVGDLASPKRNSLVGGPFGSNLVSADYVESGVPVIRGQNMSQGRWVAGEFAFVTPEKAEELRANQAEPWDLIFTQRGTLGQVALVATGDFPVYVISQSQMKLTVDRTKADPMFLYYFFSSEEQKEYIHANAIQTGVPHTNLGILRKTPVLLPPLEEQRSIASVLGILDDKIEINLRINQTLEAIARAIFKSWFVDFDPVREGHSLFASQFAKPAIGKIPRGWSVGQISDLFILQRGFDLPADRRRPGPFPVMAASGQVGFHEEPMVKGPGVTTGRSGVLGKVFLVLQDFWPLNTSLWVKEFRCSGPLHAYHVLQDLDLSVFNAGSAVPTLNRNHVHGLAVVVPPVPVVAAFESIVMPFFQLRQKNEEESRTLAVLRDTLLPKLLSGEIRVKQAEKMVGEAV